MTVVIYLTAEHYILSTSICSSGCGGEFDVKDKLVVVSPNYPDNYPNKMKCTWLISAPADKVLQFKFTDFEVEDYWSGCFDTLEIRYHAVGMKGPT